MVMGRALKTMVLCNHRVLLSLIDSRSSCFKNFRGKPEAEKARLAVRLRRLLLKESLRQTVFEI
jgi:hypothetical protein